MTDRDLLQRAEDALGLVYGQIQHVEPFVVQVLAELRTRLSTPAAEVRVPNVEALALVAYGAAFGLSVDTFDDCELLTPDHWRRAAEDVARATLAPIVEARRRHREAAERHEATRFGAMPPSYKPGELAEAFEALLSTIDSLAGVGT